MNPAVSASGRPLRPADRRLLVLRHGITEHNAAGIWQGHMDTPLSADGVAQARQVAGCVAALRPNVVVSSDLSRASQTAAEVAERAECPLRMDDRLREIHAGQWQGLSAQEVERRFPGVRAAVARGEDVRRGETGETLAEVARRTAAAAREVADGLPDGGLGVLVTHGVAARALAAELAGIPQRAAWLGLSGLGNCCWGELREHDGRWRLFAWNHAALPAGSAVDGEQSAY